MNRQTWKAGERRIAEYFKTYRTPLSGGNSRHTQSDTLHEKLFIEVKHKKKIPADKLWEKTVEFAKKEHKIPLIVLIKYQHPEPIIICRLSDIKKISGYLIEKENQKESDLDIQAS